MFDIGWPELFIVALITIIVVGPKELPRVLRTVTLWIRKIRAMARDFQDGIDDLAREADLDDMRKEIEGSAALDLDGDLEKTIDPTGEIADSVREIDGAMGAPPATEPATESATEPATDSVTKPAPKPADEPVTLPAPETKKADGTA